MHTYILYVLVIRMSDNNQNLSQSYWYTIIAEAIIIIIASLPCVTYVCTMFIYCACTYVHTYIYCMYVHTYLHTYIHMYCTYIYVCHIDILYTYHNMLFLFPYDDFAQLKTASSELSYVCTCMYAYNKYILTVHIMCNACNIKSL